MKNNEMRRFNPKFLWAGFLGMIGVGFFRYAVGFSAPGCDHKERVDIEVENLASAFLRERTSRHQDIYKSIALVLFQF